jgi:hypothetical protein
MSIGRRLLAGAVLAGFGIGLAFLTLEIGVRALHLVPSRFWQPDATLGTKLIPGASGWWTQEEHEFTVPVQINTQGRRDLERPIEKPAGSERILLLGDSFVEAMQVPIESTFARKLEAALTQPNAPVEVLSMGVSGYGTASQYLWYREHGSAFKPDVVLLSFYPGNDVRNNSPTLEASLPPQYDAAGKLQRVGNGGKGASDGTRGLLGRSEAYRYFRKFLLTRQPQVAERLADWGLLNRAALRPVPLVDGVPLDYWIYAADPPPQWREAWRHTEYLLDALRQAVEADGAKLIVMVVTAREQIYPADWEQLLQTYPAMQKVAWDVNGPERHVLDWCARTGVACIQLSPTFLTQRDQERLHFHFDGHWTAAGHALAAQTVANYLRGAKRATAQYAEGS